MFASRPRTTPGEHLVEVFPLWVVVRMAPGYTFENYLDWPEYEDNWPLGFDKGLFKEEEE